MFRNTLLLLALFATAFSMRAGNNDVAVDSIEYDGIEYYLMKDSTDKIVGYSVKGLSERMKEMTEIVIPEVIPGSNYHVYDIAANSFRNFTKLERLTIPGTVMAINSNACQNCTALEELVISGKSYLVQIGDNAFENCTSLKDIVWPEYLDYIGDSAFKGSALTSVSMGDNTQYIGVSAFENCKNLTTVNFAPYISSVQRSAFKGCESLRMVDLSHTSLKLIDDSAFYGCTELETVWFPETEASIGNSSFANCPNVTNVYSRAVTPGHGEPDGNIFDESVYRNAILHFPPASEADYRNVNNFWSKFLNTSDNLSGITEPETDSTKTVRYFNLQGMAVAEPARGEVVLVSDGKNVRKVIY